MSDNPMYWPGHQRPAWHQQPPSAQPVNSMSHYATHPGNMLGNPMAPGMPSDPSLQMQSIPGRHQPHQSTLAQQQSTLAPPGAQSSLYPSMMPAPGASGSARPTTQLTSNSHLSAATTQGIPPHPGLQQPPHPQSHYPHQYSSLASSYWNPPPMNSQSSLGPSSAPGSTGPSQGSGPPPPQSDGTSSYHSSSASPLAIPNEGRGNLSTNSSASLQQSAPSFHSPKDIQSSSDHMMSYERQRNSMTQQQQPHPSAMMSQNVPSSTASNLSPTQSQLGMPGRLQSQSQLDSMRSMSQQPPAVSNWSSSYYGQPNQSPYSSVMNPYMPYSGSASVPGHTPGPVTQPPTRPAMGQKPSANGNERIRATYPPHGASMYGQPPPTGGTTNGGYYGYDSYYNQVTGQASSDPYLSHPTSANASQHWSSSASSNQMMSNSSAAPGPIQPPLRPQSSGTSIHPQSPSSLPSLSSRPPPPASQTPERSPAPQHPSTSYPSPNQQGSSTKSTSNSLAQLEQMVMPNSGQSTTPAIKSPTHRSSTNSPSANSQQHLQYSYNSSGQGSYFSTGSSVATNPNQASYYPQYESSGIDVQKPGWSDQGPIMNSMASSSGSVMMDSSQSSYSGQPGYDSAGSYGDYTPLSAPSINCVQPRFTAPGDTTDTHVSEKSDPYAIDSQTFDDYDDQTSTSKSKKSRAKKGEEKVKKERKPRAPRAPKGASSYITQPQSPMPSSSLQVPQAEVSQSQQPLQPQQPLIQQQPPQQAPQLQPPQLPQAPEVNSVTHLDPIVAPTISLTPSDSPAHRLSTDSPIVSIPSTPAIKSPTHRSSTDSPSTSSQQHLQHPPDSVVQSSSFIIEPAATSNQTSYYSQYDSSGVEIQKQPSWSDQTSITNSMVPPPAPATQESSQSLYGSQPGFESTSSYGEYTPLSVPGNNCSQTTLPTSTDATNSSLPDESDNTAVEPQVLDNCDEQPPISKGKKSRAKRSEDKSKKEKSKPKKVEEKPKRERKPRAPRAAKASGSSSQLNQSPSAGLSRIEPQSSPQLPMGSDMSPNVDRTFTPSKSPAFGLSTESPNVSALPTSPDETLESQASHPTESTPAETKPKRIRIRDSSSKGKKKLPKFALKFAKTKKRKRLGSSDNDQSDLDKTPPPSPDEAESGVQKRRSARNTKKLKYNDDIALGFSDSDDESQVLPKQKKSNASANVTTDGGTMAVDEMTVQNEPTVFAAPVEDTMVVEKIMATRMGQRELEPEPGEVLPLDGTHIEVEEFYVKYKNLSHLHCDWRTLEELEKGDRRVAQKVKRYKQKKDSSNLFSFMDEEAFDPQYCEVDRILAVNEVEEMVPDSEDEGPADKDSKVAENPGATTDVTNVISAENERQSPMETPADDSEEKDQSKLVDKSNEQATSEVERPADESTSDEQLAKNEKLDVKKLIDAQSSEPEGEIQSTKSVDPDDAKEPEKAEEIDPEPEKSRKMKKKISRHYLVKWRGLSYEESTWELEDDLDPEKIKHFERFKDPPPKSKWRHVKRPKPEEWVRKEASPVYKNNNTLREYQLEGINWLSFCWHQGRNCILADEMGLGKTIQSIAFINEIYQYGINGPFLIIVPLSTVGNWAREFETWTDLNVITYHGSSTSREMLKEYEMFYRNEQGNRITSYYKFQVMITTFEIILSDCLDLREIPWRCCIIDEAHRLKNRNCKLLEGLRLLNMEHRVLLTGTPLQNNVEELFSLLNFLEPNQFSSTEQFLQEFGDLKTEAQVDKLKLILKPMMLRRLKEDVEKTLAPKEETIVEVELTNIQKKYYRAILEKNFSFLSKGSSNNNMPNLMNTMMELRKCCIHPYLINGAEEQIMYEARQARLAGGESMSSFQAMVNSSGKLVLIDKLLPRLRADGHRVLIFSQMVRCLDILEDYVTHKHYPFERIDGRVRGNERQQAIDRFSKPGSDRFVFLLCTRAGGLGINLTAADTVIIFDSDWNPQNDLQAQARCHRIGQSKAVKIYRLICRNTYEREMFDKASLKLGLDKAVLQSMNTQKGGSGGVDGQLTKKEIEELLRKGAYGALMDDDNAGDKFCEEDIDQILQRRTQVITIDNSEAKGSTFSKATFSSSNNREDIELDDPNFWEKWAKKANLDSDEYRSKDELIQLAPRRRTQTKRYGADGNLIDISDLESSEEDEETISMRTRGSRGRQPKLTPTSGSKRSKRSRFPEFEDDEFMASLDGGYWSKGDCLKVEKGLLTYGWGRWEEIIASNTYKRELTIEDCESICRVILLYCLNSYKGDEKIKIFAWELITPPEEANKSESEHDNSSSTRCRKSKSIPPASKKTVAEEIADASWPKEAKNDPLIALPDDQYRRHLQRNSNRLLIRVKFLHYLKNDILTGYTEKILADCHVSEVDLPSVSVDGDLPAPWWDDEADKSLLVGIFKHGHDKFNLMRQDPNLCFLLKCGPPNKDDLLAEMNCADKGVEDEDDNRDSSQLGSRLPLKLVKGQDKDAEAGEFLDSILDSVVRDLSESHKHTNDVVDENKNSILKCDNSLSEFDDTRENGITEANQHSKMDVTDDESMTNDVSTNLNSSKPETSTLASYEQGSGEFLPFPSANDLNQRFRRLTTAYQRNSKKLEIKLAQKARDELKKERNSKFEAAKNEKEERKRFLAQKWSRREEADFFRAISSFGVEYDLDQKKHDWNRFRSIGKLEKKLDETLEEYFKAFVIMCKKVTSKPLTEDEEKCPINVDTITEERAARCLSRIEFLNKIRGQIITHPMLDERLKLCLSQPDLPDWWENGIHDKELLLAAAKHGLTRLDFNLAHDTSLIFDNLIKQRAEYLLTQPPNPILIPIEQLQELLDQNGIEYLKDLELQDNSEDVKAVLESILDSIDLENSSLDSSYRSFAELVDGPHSKNCEDSLTAAIGSQSTKTPVKTTRSSSGLANLNSRPTPNMVPRRTANTIAKSSDTTGPNPQGVRLASLDSNRYEEHRLIEITPILPDKLPEELVKTFEAGEISIALQSESALLKLDDRAPIILFGAMNPVSIKIRWPKDKAIQTRLENLVSLVEKNEWPSPPKPLIPTITLPNPLVAPQSSAPISVATSSPAKNSDRAEQSLGSPKSDISNISSLTSKQDSKEPINEMPATRGRRGRGRRPRQPEIDPVPLEPESPREDRQAAAKLRNLLSQGPSSAKSSGPSSGEKLTTKFGNNKQGAGLSSLLASFKQKRAESGGTSRGRDDKNMLDLNTLGSSNLLPQILANMKPEFRDLLANQDTATMLLNSLGGMSGSPNAGSNLRSSSLSSNQTSINNLLTATRSSSKGPPPAHQRAAGEPPSAHGSSSTRELRRNSQNTRENSPPSINLRSSRCKGSSINVVNASQQKSESLHGRLPGRKRGRPSSSTSESPPGAPSADILDLSSLPFGGKTSSAFRPESRSRRHRDQPDETSTTTRSSSNVPTKASLRASARQHAPQSEPEQSSPDKGVRTTRASKRIGSRIDALALNLQAKRLNRGDSPTSDISPSFPKEKSHDSPMAAHGSGKQSSDHKSQSSKAPPAAHSGSHQLGSSNSLIDQQGSKTNQTSTASTPAQPVSASSSRQDPIAQFMSNSTSLLAGLNPATLGGAGDLMNQLLRKAGSNDIVKNLLNEFMKNPSLALDPNIIATLSASLPVGAQGLPNFNLPGQAPTSLPSTSSKAMPSSLLNDFKPPSGSSLMKRSRHESGSASTRHSSSNNSVNPSSESRRSSSTSATDRHDRRSSSSADKRTSSSSSSSFQDRSEKHGKHEKRSSSTQQDASSDAASRRSSSSLLAQQTPLSQPIIPTSSTSTSSQAALPNAATLNLANQFGLNSLGGLLGFPGVNMNELMKQMSNFPGLTGTLPRASGGSNMTPNSTLTTNTSNQSNSDKGSRRSRQSSGTSAAQTSTVSSQQAANAALANSIMNLASQPNSVSNPYSNYTNPLTNPFLPFGLANLGMNNPLGMGFLSNLYMPPGFPTPDQQQPQIPNQTGGPSDGNSKDKKMRYPRK